MSPRPLLLFMLLIAAAACSSGDDGAPAVMPLPDGRVTFYAAGEGDQAGAIVAGDFNGDGAQDIVLGAAGGDGPDDTRVDTGEAYLFLGPFEAGSELDAGAGSQDAMFYGPEPGARLGLTLAAADFDGDGIDDLAVAAPAAHELAGTVYVVFGGDWPTETDFAEDAADVTLTGGDAGDWAGFTLAAGKLGGGDAASLVAGALAADGAGNAREESGEVYILDGSALTDGATIDLGSLDGGWSVVLGADPGDRLGEALAIGELNGDGRLDLALVATFAGGEDNAREAAGETYFLYELTPGALDLRGVSANVTGADAGDQLGHSIGIGDADGDGLGDAWLGAVSADGPGNAVDLAGEAVLVPGNAESVDAAVGPVSALIYGPGKEARLGRSLTVADLDGDGRADLVISAPNLDARAGRLFIFSGGSFPEDASEGAALGGIDAGDVIGHEAFGMPSLSAADVDGDGQVELLVSAPNGDGPANARPDCGEAYILTAAELPG